MRTALYICISCARCLHLRPRADWTRARPIVYALRLFCPAIRSRPPLISFLVFARAYIPYYDPGAVRTPHRCKKDAPRPQEPKPRSRNASKHPYYIYSLFTTTRRQPEPFISVLYHPPAPLSSCAESSHNPRPRRSSYTNPRT